MVNEKDEKPVRSSRLSLQVERKLSELPESPLRHTLSQNDGSKRRKKYAPHAPPTIIEVEGAPTTASEVKSDTFMKAANRGSKRSSTRGSSRKLQQHAYDNSGFDNISTTGSTASIPIPLGAIDRNASTRTSQRSLSVVEERYCCFNRLSKCEKRLVLVIAVLTFLIIVLIVVIGVLASDSKDDNAKSFFHNIFR